MNAEIYKDQGHPQEPLHSLHDACRHIVKTLKNTHHSYFFAMDLACDKYKIKDEYQVDKMFKKMYPDFHPFQEIGRSEIFRVEDYYGMGSFWKIKGLPGVFRSYGEAIAMNMDMWEEMCDYYRSQPIFTTRDLLKKKIK